MSGINDRNLAREMEPILQAAGLPTIQGKLIGKKFVLAVASGKLDSILSGTITSFSYAKGGSVVLCISSPEVFGCPIMHVVHDGEKWQLLFRDGQKKVFVNECQFDLIDN